MNPDKILFIDTETGGIDPSKNSLLSIGLAVWQDFKIIDTIEILIKEKKLNVTQESLKINGIDIKEHTKVALTPENAIQKFNTFLQKHFSTKTKITLAGHNINFDVNFLKEFLLKNKYDYHKRFSHRYVDTATILYYLYLANKLKKKAISSQDAFDLFNIVVDKRHSSLGDVVATANLFTILLKKVSKNIRLKDVEKSAAPELFSS